MSIRRNWRIVGAVVGMLAVLSACGDQAGRSLCDAFADWTEARATINAIDPTSEDAATYAEDVDDYRSAVDALRETADSRYRAAIDDLDAATADVLRTLESVDDAEYSTWAPLVEDSIDDATIAAERVVELIGPQCDGEPEQD
jgi:hypothetical protein